MGKQKEQGEPKKKKNRRSCCTLSIDIGYFGDSFFGSNVFKNPARCAKSKTTVNI